jgi:hypothetical protein
LASRDTQTDIERRLDNARQERDAWRGKGTEHYQLAVILVQRLEKQLQNLATGKGPKSDSKP